MMSTPWRLLLEEYPNDPALNLALDEAIAQHVGRDEVPPTLRFWRNAKTLVLGRFEHRLPRFQEAVELMNERGLTVLQRMSGGGAVLNDMCDVNFSIAVPIVARGDAEFTQFGIHEAYETLCRGVVEGLRRFGMHCSFGRIDGSFCDGSHNLVVAGKKIAGTAQARRKGFILVHGTLLAQSDVERIAETIGSFYQAAGGQVTVRATSLTTLAQQCNRSLEFEEVCDVLTNGYRSTGDVERKTILATEYQLAEQIKAAAFARGKQAFHP